MKNFQIPLVAFTLLLGACSSMQNTSRYTANDDLYYSLADAKKNSEITYNQSLSSETIAAASFFSSLQRVIKCFLYFTDKSVV